MLKNTKELLEMCDKNIEKVSDSKKDYIETIIYLLDERGILEEESENLGHSYDRMLTFDSFNGATIPLVYSKKDGGRTNVAIENMVKKMYKNGGTDLLDKFMEYLVTEAIPKFRAGINIQNFEY